MKYDFYENVVEEYLSNYSERTKATLEKIGIDKSEVEFAIESEKENIEKLIKTNKKYAQLVMDLDLFKNNKLNNFVSLTHFARRKNEANPGYVIQSWLRDRNTLEFLRLWEKEHNYYSFDDEAAIKLIERTHEPSFTITAKVWISETNAKGIQSKQGANGGTFAAEQISIDFITWLYPEKRYELIKLISMRAFIMRNQLKKCLSE